MECYICKCGATIEIEVATDEYYVAECFECDMYEDHASLFELKKRLKSLGCKCCDENDENK